MLFIAEQFFMSPLLCYRLGHKFASELSGPLLLIAILKLNDNEGKEDRRMNSERLMKFIRKWPWNWKGEENGTGGLIRR